jgi:hypothetical protein
MILSCHSSERGSLRRAMTQATRRDRPEFHPDEKKTVRIALKKAAWC